MVSSMQLFPLRYSPLISSRIVPFGSLKTDHAPAEVIYEAEKLAREI